MFRKNLVLGRKNLHDLIMALIRPLSVSPRILVWEQNHPGGHKYPHFILDLFLAIVTIQYVIYNTSCIFVYLIYIAIKQLRRLDALELRLVFCLCIFASIRKSPHSPLIHFVCVSDIFSHSIALKWLKQTKSILVYPDIVASPADLIDMGRMWTKGHGNI